MKSNSEITADFDLIARVLRTAGARELSRSERALLALVPSSARTALDVGCGDGAIARALAQQGLRVSAVDLSPGMIALARRSTTVSLPVNYVLGDVLVDGPELGVFDVVICVNVLHHVPIASAVARLTELVAPGGLLLIQDVVARPGLRYLPMNLAGAITRVLRRIARRAAPDTRELREAYRAHGHGEEYLTPQDADTAYQKLLPGTRITHHLEWRYSAAWSRPPAT